MGATFDCASSSLLCAEDNSSILGFDDDDKGVDGEVVGNGPDEVPGQRNGFDGESLMGLALQSAECVALMFERESEHLPSEDYAERLLSGALDPSVRKDAIDWIGKVHAQYGFGPLSAYLTVNYLDRFLSAYELPQGKAWMAQLLSVACLSLAAKMEETEVPLSLDLQVGEAKYVFEAKTIQRMELLVLSTLKWRMQAMTPFSFIDYFLHKFSNGNSLTNSLVSRSMGLILATIGGIEFLKFRPSEVAAAVALTVLGEMQIVGADKVLASCSCVNQESVLKCYELIQEMALMKRINKNASPSASLVPQSPIGVLDAACLSYKSDETTVGSQANSHQTSPAAKRWKPSKPSIS